MNPKPLWNPYVAGVFLGAVLLASFLLMGKGLGASGAANRLGVTALHTVAPAHVESNPAWRSMFDAETHPLDSRLVFMGIGVLLGGLLGAATGRRLGVEVVRGPRIGVSGRLAGALIGGLLMGAAARLSLGCTSGQALSGGSLQSVGAWAFMFSVFGGGYAVALLVKKEWT